QLLLAGAVADPVSPVSELPLLTEAERFQTLSAWNDTASAPLSEPWLQRRFLAVAARYPQEVALIHGERRLPFAEVAHRAECLAAGLAAWGVGPEVVVGLRFERSPELVIAALGVLMAGGAYLPLDPAHPEERQAMLLADAGAALVLTPETWPDAPARALPEVDPEGLAYVLYTSGSTGRPKGVMVQHRALARYLDWAVVAYAAAAGQGAPVHSSLAFDLTVTGLWAPLLAGRAVTLLPEEHGIEALAATVRPGADFSLVKLTPAHLDLLAQQVSPESVAGWTRALVVGGEALRQESLAFWREHAPQTRIFNEYGPTETVVGCSVYEVPASAAGALPIGRPIAGARLYVLDRGFQPVPLGVAGELCIGGEGVTRGYRGDPARTAERFVPDPFSEPGARLYRSGDLARWRADGMLEYLGRTDHQLKVRGFRIEPGEIEAALLEHPGARECVVVAREDAAGVRLVAYVAGDGLPGPELRSSELRSFLSRRLPEYMLPSAFVVLDALPLTPNGKVDRRALPASTAPERTVSAGGEARDPVEELLAGIWAEVLGLDRVGVEESFFELGGHSLLATQVVSRVRTVLGVELPVRALFEAPTVAELARRIALEERGAEASSIPRADRDRPLALSFAQLRLWFFDQLEPGSAVYNIPLAVRAHGTLDLERLARVFAGLIWRHESLRTAFAAVDGRPVQRIAAEQRLLSGGGPLLDLSGLPDGWREAEAQRQADAEAARPFDLARGPLLRVVLLRMEEEDHAVLVTMHHIVSDGWSMGVFLRELAALYTDAPLPELPIQYADFAAWQRSWLDGEALDSELAYWRQRLAGAPPLLELPTDRPRPAVQTTRGHTLAAVLPPGLSARLAAASRREGATLFMVLLSACSTLLGRLADQDDVLVGSPIAGRNRKEVEGLIGMFVNTLVFRTDLSGAPSFRRLLARVRATALDAYAHQEMPFDKLVEELAPARSLSHSPLFQVMLLLQNLPAETLTLPGLTLRRLPGESRTTQFDLVLGFEETPRGLAASLLYNADLFDGATVARMLGQVERLLDGATAELDRPVSELPLVSEAERHQLVQEWNGAAPEGTLNLCLQDLLDRQRDLAPDSLAALGEDGTHLTHLTYSELHARAERLARRLRRLGVGPDVPVAVCLERSPELLVALLAALKAGGVYLPLDPSYPPERRAFVLEDSGAPVVLDRGSVFATEAAGELPRPLPTSLAWIVYTSGSTGKPKGVGVEHGRAVRHLASIAALYGVGRGDRVLAFSSPSFDVSMEDLFVPLTTGATVVLRGPELWEPEDLLERVRALQLTMLDLPTAYFHQWLGGAASKAPETGLSLRLILIGGEALPVESERLWAVQGLPGVRLVNGYGPTEAIVTATASTAGRASIGRPVAGRCVFVLDRRGELVPAGAAGELCLGGPLLARGYLGQPALTAERFVPDPFAEE
ncbi:MAG TPA: amino acid adenylation domain-containing protein, partial [Thermoanaerobaculia bacterium]|nr:amino acid adenylation domain-containing protein [Thermoanaerobaculia bacterium]